MTVTRDDAASALHAIDRAERHSLTLFGYSAGSPYLLLWGPLWIVAGAVGALSPENAGLGWAAVDAIGLAGTAGLVIAQNRRFGEKGDRTGTWRFLGAVAVLAAFIAMTFAVFAPVSGVQIQTFIVLLVAAAYALVGCWFGLRFAAVGAVLAGLAVGAFYHAPAHAAWIVPLLGGGALILAGLWMRRAR